MASSRFLTFTDPYEYQRALRATPDIMPTTKGDFRASLTQVNFDRVRTQAGSESLPRIMRGPETSDRVIIGFPHDLSNYRINGVDASIHTFITHGAHELHQLSFGPSRWGSMSLSHADLAIGGRSISGRELERPRFSKAIRPRPALMSHLQSLHVNVTKLAKEAPQMLLYPEVARALEDALLHAMIRCMSDAAGESLTDTARSHIATVAKLEDFMAENWDRPVHLGELCEKLGVSESTLRRCCNQQLGIGPNRYLWLRRMHLARRALLRADPTKTNVTAVATAQGFWELGRFSIAYRSLFGEPPSATLRRPPQGRPSTNRPLDLPMVAAGS
jgi:AraC-like DNA-binding protein